MEDRRTPAEKEFDEKHEWLHLDPELYYDSISMTRFVILTNEQLKQVKKWTLENMKKLDSVTGTKGFMESDYAKLQED